MTNKEKYDELYDKLERALHEEAYRAKRTAEAVHGGDAVMLDDIPEPDEEKVAQSVVDGPLPEPSLVAIVRCAMAEGAWGEAAEDLDEVPDRVLFDALLSKELAVRSIMAEFKDDRLAAEQYLHRLFCAAGFHDHGN